MPNSDINLEKLKAQKLKELQEKFNAQDSDELQKHQELQSQVTQLENLIKQRMSREALIRYSNIKTVNKEKALQLLAILSQLIQYKKQDESITDQELKEILKKIQEQKRETKIHFTK